VKLNEVKNTNKTKKLYNYGAEKLDFYYNLSYVDELYFQDIEALKIKIKSGISIKTGGLK